MLKICGRRPTPRRRRYAPLYGFELAEELHLHPMTATPAEPEEPHDGTEVRPQRDGSATSGPRHILFATPKHRGKEDR